MSYRESYLVPKSEFEKLLKGKLGTSSNLLKRKNEEESGEKKRKKETNPRKKTPPSFDEIMGESFVTPPGFTSRKTSRKIPDFKQIMGDSFLMPSTKPSKMSTEGFFQGKKKPKQMRLMKFLNENKDLISVNDDMSLNVFKKKIPGSDYIDIISYLMMGSSEREKNFFPSLKTETGMPKGTRRFVRALYEAATGQPFSTLEEGNERKLEQYATKISRFAGLSMSGLKEVMESVQRDNRTENEQLKAENEKITIEREKDEILEEEEKEKAEEVMRAIEDEEKRIKEFEGVKTTLETSLGNLRRKKKSKGYILKRILDEIEGEEEAEEKSSESSDDPDIEEHEKEAGKRRRREKIKKLDTIGKRMREHEITRFGGKDPASRLVEEYVATRGEHDPDSEEILSRFGEDRLDRVESIVQRLGESEGVLSPAERELKTRQPTEREILKGNVLSQLLGEDEGSEDEDDTSLHS